MMGDWRWYDHNDTNMGRKYRQGNWTYSPNNTGILIERTGKETGDGTNVLPLLFCVGLGFVSMSCLQT